MSELFSNQSSIYKTYRPQYPQELYDFLIKNVRHTDLALDCGSGNGQVAWKLVEYFDQVIAVDASREQIEQADHHEKITFRNADASDTGCEDSSVDLLTAAQSLHWFNLDKFYKEAHRVLKPGGLLACWGYGLCSVSEHIDPLIRSFYDDVIGPFWPRQRIHIEQRYNGLRFPYHQLNTPDFIMKKSWRLDQFLGYLRSWSSTNRFIQYKGYDPVRTLAVRLKRQWGNTDDERIISWPVFMKAGYKE